MPSNSHLSSSARYTTWKNEIDPQESWRSRDTNLVVRVSARNGEMRYLFFYFFYFEIYLFRVTRSSVINSCFSTRPWLNNTTTIHAWTTCGNSQCSYMTLQINFESIQWPGVFNSIWKRIPDHCTSIYKGAAHAMCSTQWYIQWYIHSTISVPFTFVLADISGSLTFSCSVQMALSSPCSEPNLAAGLSPTGGALWRSSGSTFIDLLRDFSSTYLSQVTSSVRDLR